MNREALSLDVIRTDGGTQQRAEVPTQAVADYAELVRAGHEFPPVVVFCDGKRYWLGDGFIRTAAHRAAGKTEIVADVRRGSRRDAILYSCGANADHGCRRSNDDKRRAVRTLLEDAEWGARSDAWVAERARVNSATVAKLRRELAAQDPKSDPGEERRVGRDGKAYPAQRGSPAQQAPESPASDAEEERADAGLERAADGRGEAARPTASPPAPRTGGGEGHVGPGEPGTSIASSQLAETPPPPAGPVDDLGIPVRPHAAEAFAALPEFEELRKTLLVARKRWAELCDGPGGAYLTAGGVSYSTRDGWRHAGIETALLNLKDCRPALTLCPYAFHETAAHGADCPLCRGLNWSRPIARSEGAAGLVERMKEAHGV